MREGVILSFNEKTGQGRVKIKPEDRNDYIGHLEMYFDYHSTNNYAVSSGEMVYVELGYFREVPKVIRIVKR